MSTINATPHATDSQIEAVVEQLRAARSALRLGLGPRRTLRLADTTRRAALLLDESVLALASGRTVPEPIGAEPTAGRMPANAWRGPRGKFQVAWLAQGMLGSLRDIPAEHRKRLADRAWWGRRGPGKASRDLQVG